MRRGLPLGLLLLAPLIGGAAAADGATETCAPYVAPAPATPATTAASKPATPTAASKPPAPRPIPTAFNAVACGTSGPTLVFVGDSLTAGAGTRFPRQTASLLGDRAFTAYALGGQPSGVLVNIFSAETLGPDDVGIIWMGRNNEPEEIAPLIADIDTAVGHVPAGKFLVLSVLSGRYDSEQPGERRRAKIDTLNAQLAARYGDRFVWTRPLISCADYEDNVHLREGGYDRIADAVAKAIAAKGW